MFIPRTEGYEVGDTSLANEEIVKMIISCAWKRVR